MAVLELQPLCENLLPAVVALDRLALGGLWTLEGYARELDSPNSDLLVLRAAPTPERPEPPPLVGLACLWSILEEAHITLLAIDPHYRRQGFGQTLLYALLDRAWKRQLEWATLEVRFSNRAALSLYQQFGFTQVGIRRGYYKETGEDARILWRSGLKQPDFPETLAQWQSQIHDRLARSHWSLSLPDDL
ncbi:MAG: ribosomal-protein-alanine N-acetyltransferase [Cyanobacteria bacterium J007]|nr:MAG: ribosomal-protein-alanine N-acetyltransferase [Cyanobacteria bacterium J007]